MRGHEMENLVLSDPEHLTYKNYLAIQFTLKDDFLGLL